MEKKVKENRNPIEKHTRNVRHKYQKTSVITARLFHEELEFVQEVLVLPSVWSSKEISSSFESTDIMGSDVGMAVIYMLSTDKWRKRVSSSQCPSFLSSFFHFSNLWLHTQIPIFYTSSLLLLLFISGLFQTTLIVLFIQPTPSILLQKSRLLKD